MSLKALFIANAVMILFVGLVIIQSFVGMNAGHMVEEMRQSGFIASASKDS